MKANASTLCKFLLTTLILCATSLRSQQLIFNGDLESTTQTVHYRQSSTWLPATFASGWGRANLGTPDVFTDYTYGTCGSISDPAANPANSTCYPEACVSDNNFGYQYPRHHTNADDGNTSPNHNYVFLHNGEYLQQHLSAPLVTGSCYHLQFWVSRCDKDGQASRMQAVFSATDMNNNGTGQITPPSTALVLTNHHFNVQKLNSGPHEGWELVQFDFKAIANCNYITIGVFDTTGTGSGLVTESESTVAGDCMTCGSANCITTGLLYGLHAYFVDDVSLTPSGENFSAAHSFTNTNISPANTYSNSTILLTGSNTVTGTVTWTNCRVRCNTASTLTIQPGANLILNNDTLRAGCSFMWNGIIVNGNGKITMSSSAIEDAIIGITFNQGQWAITGNSTNNSYFTRNATDIVFNNSGPQSNILWATTFDHTTALADPTQGTNGFPTTGIVCNAQGTSPTTMTIGSTIAGLECKFIKGVNGITSIKRNLNVKGCQFTNITLYDIYFQGIDSKRSLSVTQCLFNSTVTAIDWGIFSTTRTNLTVTSSKFDRKALGIAWYDSPDCDLTIGQAGTSVASILAGNTFNSCFYGIVTFNDRSSGNNIQQYAGGNYAGGQNYTDITIANNLMYGNFVNPSNIQTGTMQYGIWMSEFVVGSNVSYHHLDISRNGFQYVQTGVRVDNVNGWGSFLINTLNPDTNFMSKIEKNTVYLSTQYSPWANGIALHNVTGAIVDANDIASTAFTNWQNYGIYIENCNRTECVGNFAQAGTGIVLASNELWSNVHCNTLYGTSCGINLAGCQLRPYNIYHGLQQANGYEAFNNFAAGPTYPSRIDFQSYYTVDSLNKWVWDFITASNPKVLKFNATTNAIETNGITGALISPPLPSSTTPVLGVNNCSSYPDYQGIIFNPHFAQGPNSALSLADPNDQWIADYRYQEIKNATGQGNSGQASQNIKRILKIEDAMAQQDFNLASAQLNGLNPTNTYESNFKDYLTVMLAVENPVREATQPEKNTLIAIAQQNPRTGGIAVYLARAYLFYSDRMTFQDEDFTGPKVSGMAYIQSPCCLTPASGTTLTFSDASGNELPIAGATVYQDGSFTFDPFQINYYSSLNPTTLYRITEKSPSKFTSLSKDFKTLSDWIAASPVTVYLGGAKLDTTKVTATQDTVIARVTSMQDQSGNTVTVSSTSNQSSDFLIQKYSNTNQLLWSRTFDGPSSGSDSALSMTMDGDGSVYVAGKVWNGNHYDFQTLKYDSTGFLMWSCLLDDTLGRDNEPMGIGVCPFDHTVYVTGKCCHANQLNYRIAKYSQCVTTNSNRIMQPQLQESTVVPVDLIEYFPNPTDGKLNIVLKNSSGGLIELFDVNGRLAYSRKIEQSGVIDNSEMGLSDGVYFLKFTDNSGTPQFGKLIIQHQ